jgi:hypothetical protein
MRLLRSFFSLLRRRPAKPAKPFLPYREPERLAELRAMSEGWL